MVIKSIQKFLFISLFLSTLFVSSITILGDYLLNAKDIQAQQDAQLIGTAHILDTLANQVDLSTIKNLPQEKETISDQLKLITTVTQSNVQYKRPNTNIEFEIWNQKDVVLFRSSLTLSPPFDKKENGLQHEKINNESWRSYSLYDKNKKLHILVAQEDRARNSFLRRLMKDNVLIMLLTYPLISLAIWFFIKIALRSFNALVNQITHRASSHLEPVDANSLPTEIFPFAEALNNLFFRLKLSIEQMKRFSSNASHELRTPLAIIKTQAQVALASTQDSERKTALANVLTGVDRASHVVKQLLILSRLEPDSSVNNVTSINFSRLVIDITAQLTPSALKKHIDIEVETHGMEHNIIANETSVEILVRNLIDNAIRYTPEHGQVRIELISNPYEHITLFRVTDNGPGIPAEYRAKVFERFFRVLGTKESGSGLGLAIVKQIADLHKARINLGVPPSGAGLQIDVIFPNNIQSMTP